MSKCTIFVGPFIHSIYEDQIACVENGVIAVSDGKIVAVADDGDVNYIKSTLPNVTEIVTLKNGEFLCPGFIDLHIHASQYPNAGLGYDSELIHWLNKYTYPLEQKYDDDIFARKVYRAVVNRTLSCGTTTAVYFGTIHLNSNMVLAEELVEAGQRAFVGKVNMNVRSPPGYLETTESSINDTEKFISHVKNFKCPLVQPIITPRFALTCDLTLMERLAELAKKYDLYIQSHVSENKDEVKCMNELYPEFENYTDIYDKAGLLTDKTVLAHGVYLTPSELKVLSERRTAIAHCPVSNTSLKSGLCDIKLLIREGVLVGLGTDVSGGYSPSILNTIRAAIDTSIHVSFTQKDCYSPLTFHEAFYLATLGGAKALKLENSIGNFTVGKDFDALRINLYSQDSQIDCFEDLSLIEKVQKFLYLGDDRNIRQVYVNGKLVKNKKNIIN